MSSCSSFPPPFFHLFFLACRSSSLPLSSAFPSFLFSLPWILIFLLVFIHSLSSLSFSSCLSPHFFHFLLTCLSCLSSSLLLPCHLHSLIHSLPFIFILYFVFFLFLRRFVCFFPFLPPFFLLPSPFALFLPVFLPSLLPLHRSSLTSITVRATVDKPLKSQFLSCDDTSLMTLTHCVCVCVCVCIHSPVSLVFLPTLFLLLSVSGWGAAKPIDGEGETFAYHECKMSLRWQLNFWLFTHHCATTHSTSGFTVS